ncbi:efflux transporter outer membrane subunit [Pseudothauera rhizosphaerae]|uniref:Efflux transporter outer membrane subunit n=1 Tax=Pseudothauera rhizosphaerae TaxID=2565932 RepID=A0A4S4B068_9RHOO|nr:efflux transporter outer membrane subunit [Pseudothauera rhizosphaerae]THF65399.1 efflux transporter outer membrane subunit [Pseudothauera rhizosphaerae]
MFVSPPPAARRTPGCLAAALLVALAGCATRPYAPAAGDLPAVPPAWTESAVPAGGDEERLALWWRHFGDAELSALVELALARNTDVRSARAALRQARAQRTVSAAGLQPTLDFTGSAQRARTDSQPASNQFQVGVDAGWELDLAGGLRAGLAAAEADLGASAASLEDTRVSIAAEVALAYIDLRGNQRRLAVARANLANQEETLQITRWREQAGLVTLLEVEQARGTVEETRASLSSLESAIVQALNSLAVLGAQTPGSLHARLDAPGETLPAVPRPVAALAVSLPADTLRQRPDVRAAEHRVTAARARVDEAQAARYPSLNLTGSLGLSALTFGALDSAGVASSLLASLGLPLFDGGARAAQAEVRDAELEQAYHAYSAAVLEALREVENALTALRTSRDALASLEQAAEAAATADTLAGQRYASGLVDFQVVLDTQRTRLNAEDAVASAAAQLAANHVQLYKALGGGWSAQAESPAASTPAPPSTTGTPSPAP